MRIIVWIFLFTGFSVAAKCTEKNVVSPICIYLHTLAPQCERDDYVRFRFLLKFSASTTASIRNVKACIVTDFAGWKVDDDNDSFILRTVTINTGKSFAIRVIGPLGE